MYFKISKNRSEIPLYSTNEDLKERWCVVAPEKLEKYVGGKWGWFKLVTDPTINEKRKIERTGLYLGYDGVVERPVIVKVLQYTPNDLESVANVNKKRDVLIEQIRLLNDISSPLLPEPLDWFEINNSVDSLPNDELSKTEPVLILDYQPGIKLENTIKSNRFRRQENSPESINIERVGRLISYIKYFLKTVYEKGYIYIGLSPEHILLLKDDVPRFVGLGSLCRIKDGKLDDTHINFGRTIKGYSAPELNCIETNFGIGADAKAAGIFSLGVILAQILCEATTIEDDILENGSFKYPNEKYEKKIKALRKGDRIHYLLTRLCDSNPDTRLTDFDEIENILEELKGDKQVEITGIKDNIGEVKFYNVDKGFGYITDLYFNVDYYISAKILQRSGIDSLCEKQRIKFDIIGTREKSYAANIVALKPGESVMSKRQEQELQRREEKKRKELERQKELERKRALESRKELERKRALERLKEMETQRILERQKELERQRVLERQRALERRKEKAKTALSQVFSWLK